MTIELPTGSFTIQAEERTIVSTQTGPFDLEYVQNYARDMSAACDAHNATGPYLVLSIYRGLLQYRQDALDFVFQHAAQVDSARKNCVAIAVVAEPGVRGVQTIKPYFDYFFQLRGMSARSGRLFDDVTLARRWLKEHFDVAQGNQGVSASDARPTGIGGVTSGSRFVSRFQY
jgi:hypothetical protein